MQRLVEILKKAASTAKHIGKFQLGVNEIRRFVEINSRHFGGITLVFNLGIRYWANIAEVYVLYRNIPTSLAQGDYSGTIIDGALILGTYESIKFFANQLSQHAEALEDLIYARIEDRKRRFDL